MTDPTPGSTTIAGPTPTAGPTAGSGADPTAEVLSTPAPVGATVLGYPRQGPRRRLKRAVEGHWQGRVDPAELLQTGVELRRQRWQELTAAGLTEVPVGDFSYYDHVLDTTLMLGAVPARFGRLPDRTATDRLTRTFALARGTAEQAPLEMTKWFDTNYHYLVPELDPGTTFVVDARDLLDQLGEAHALGLDARPVVLGPFSYLSLAKPSDPTSTHRPLDLLESLVPVYAELLEQLHQAGAGWVQLDEPALVLDQSPETLDRFARTYRGLLGTTSRPRLMVASYFGELGPAADVLTGLGLDGLALDLSTGPDRDTRTPTVAALRTAGPALAGTRLLAGVVDGRSVWRTDLRAALRTLTELRPLVGRLDVSTSCSLLHLPLDLDVETSMGSEVRSWLAFARQKAAEVGVLARGLAEGEPTIAAELDAVDRVGEQRRTSPLVVRPDVRQAVAAVTPGQTRRSGTAEGRRQAQQDALGLPLLPTTTIGSFPQTPEVRRARAAWRRGELDEPGYTAAMRAEIDRVLTLQTDLGLDVLVHGEPERNDMVQYFAEQLDGFVTTEEGWVQSYGTRYVRPPIVVGDVARPEPITVPWTRYAQSRTDQPVKGMLTGPVTMLAWSFGRDDLAAAGTAAQIALALRGEVAELERAGTRIIQVDEPALRETLPLRSADRPAYLDWAVRAFLLTTAGVAEPTQVHTHMCYAEFGEILPAIIAMDADVISLEAARSRMEVVGDLVAADYPHGVGPGVWDIHSPRVPSAGAVTEALERALAAGIPADRLWVNPDCGLKTRGYAEVEPALAALVAAATTVRHRQ